MHRALELTHRSRLRRALLVTVVVLAAVATLVTQRSDEAAASAGDEAAFVAALNQIRADAGLPAFTVNGELAALARGHAQVMADAGEIFHADPISAGFTGGWTKLGENVGVGANVSVLVDAFVASEGHFANIVDPSFSQIGVGVIWKDSAMYTTHRFLQPVGSAPAPPAPPPAPPAVPDPPPPTESTPPPTPIPSPAPTTTTVPPLDAPAISATRVLELLEMLDRVGT